ncbi:Methylcobalamin:coenzyme M methyltransferase MtbA [Methanonatronarchaeum thermophilum]|uniref:Methylcobalamin:coenzyme M methyltransferase MtbA n=1 Tax=Methanonatronarchaeum thermophilum TaxID=1927129 RepID=A0A1Y3GDM7_9EURY|nr:methylcobamide:CoM methyltransferase MtaA [Methanonatronarchaeum thermophilum]OUJ19327.1 Methylcobalamin:coenzyme M methyltransferase MtbA [Methanonatronarchaeum thermophilum]
MNLRERFLGALRGEEVDMVPAVSVTQTGTVDFMEASGSSWPEAHYDAEKMADLAVAAYEVGGLESVRYPYCLTALAEVVGCGLKEGTRDTQPSVETHPGLDGIEMPDDLSQAGRVPEILEAANLVRSKVGDEVPIIVGIEAPDELAAHILGSSNYIKGLITDPEMVEEALEVSNELSMEYAQLVLDSGADAVCVPGYSTLDIVDPNSFKNLIKPTYREFVENVDGDIIMHMCGHIDQIIGDLADCGFEGISIEAQTEIQKAKEIIGNKASVIGNISTPNTLLNGSPQEVIKECQQALKAGTDILAPGCGLAPRTPTENVQAIVKARNQYYQK